MTICSRYACERHIMQVLSVTNHMSSLENHKYNNFNDLLNKTFLPDINKSIHNTIQTLVKRKVDKHVVN